MTAFAAASVLGDLLRSHLADHLERVEELLGAHRESLLGDDFAAEVQVGDRILLLQLRAVALVTVDVIRHGRKLQNRLCHI